MPWTRALVEPSLRGPKRRTGASPLPNQQALRARVAEPLNFFERENLTVQQTQTQQSNLQRRISMPQVKRVVIGVGPGKKSTVIHRDSPNHQEVPYIFWRSTLWAATELPVNN